MSDETPEERQKNEFEALQAIYGELVEDKRMPTAWKVWRPNDFLLTLFPLHNSAQPDVYCSVTLHITCCHNYPDKPPKIEVAQKKGLSNENVEKLLSQLVNMASEKCGEVMVFELAQHTQQFLYDHNIRTISCYEEMEMRKNEEEKLKQQDIEIKEQEERQKINDEIQRRQELLKCAGRQRNHGVSLSQVDSLEGQGDAPELYYYADQNMSPAKSVVRKKSSDVACTCNLKCTQVLRITQKNHKKVYIGNCLGHSSNGATSYLAIEDETGEPLLTKKWSIPTPDFQAWNRFLTLLQQELKSMCRLKHTNLVPYIAMETCKESVRTTNQSVYILRNFVLGSSLKYFLDKCKSSDTFETLKLIRHIGVGVFSALSELHSADVVHKDVRSENVYLDVLGAVKLVGASLDSLLAERLEGENFCEKQTQAQDIYAAGHLLLSILCQEKTIHEVPPELPSAAKDFFSRCLTEDEHSQWSAEQLMNHGFLVDVPVKQLIDKRKDDGGSGSDEEDPVKKIRNLGPAHVGHSRLANEFEVLTWLGQGAFGDVLKVKNKLDGGFYAIKRIKLNPESVQLNKKITREVKLLSRLNHENVVRYYNAWIESTVRTDPVEGDTSTTSDVKTPKKKPDSLEDVVAKLGEVKVEWSMCDRSAPKRHSSSDSEDDDDEDDDDDDEPNQLFNISPEDESSSIEFASDSQNKSNTIASGSLSEDSPRPPSAKLNQVLYIQMEFCEKSTLRQAIDNGLCQEHFRAWRLFREIVEGLAHVHQRGMIHRDLKPVNIFLDSNDHVKIGDFGLATKAFTALVDDKEKPEEINGSLTGQVGTALYVAPELYQAGTKGIYNQKVDIYSLGIILFEMFHPPLATAMERMSVLNNIRSKDIVMPKDFERDVSAKQIHVIRWLLNHDASLRPTCAELLSSEHIPRPVHEGTVAGLLSHALNERDSRGYTRLIKACLDQRASPAEDYTFHNDMKKEINDVLVAVKEIVVRVFRSHGAHEFNPPLLTPRAKGWEQLPNAVKVMTTSGTVCHLPHDLRLPFARHTAYNGIKYMRRYVIDRVYRERHGYHPREIVECAFDIVTPKTDYLWSDAELLVVASRAAIECSLNVTIQLNHPSLLQTLLLFCGVPIDKHSDILPVLVNVSFGRLSKLQLQTHLTSLCITNQDVSNILKIMETDIPVQELKEFIGECKLNAKLSKVATQATHALQAVYRNARALGCECPITVAPFLAYNVSQHTGVFWQMFATRQTGNKSNTKRRSGVLIAVGGRYDALVEKFWKVTPKNDNPDSELKSCSAGFSMSLERMAAILKKVEEIPPVVKYAEPTVICVCIDGTAGSGRDGQSATKRANLAKELWSCGYNCCVWTSTQADAHELSHADAVLWQDDAFVRISCPDGKINEHKLPFHEVIDFIKQKFSPDTQSNHEVTTNRSISWSESEKSNSPSISVTFISTERLQKNTKRFLENQIFTKVTSLLVNIGLQQVMSRVRVSVFALAVEANVVRMLAAQLAVPLDHSELASAFQPVFDSYAKSYDILDDTLKELTSAAKQTNHNRSSDETHLFALFSIPDSLCRLIT